MSNLTQAFDGMFDREQRMSHADRYELAYCFCRYVGGMDHNEASYTAASMVSTTFKESLTFGMIMGVCVCIDSFIDLTKTGVQALDFQHEAMEMIKTFDERQTRKALKTISKIAANLQRNKEKLGAKEYNKKAERLIALHDSLREYLKDGDPLHIEGVKIQRKSNLDTFTDLYGYYKWNIRSQHHAEAMEYLMAMSKTYKIDLYSVISREVVKYNHDFEKMHNSSDFNALFNNHINLVLDVVNDKIKQDRIDFKNDTEYAKKLKQRRAERRLKPSLKLKPSFHKPQ